MKVEYIKNDDRVFTIRPFHNPYKRKPFKVKKDSYKRDSRGNAIKTERGFQTQTSELETVVMPGASHHFTASRRRDNGKLLTGLDIEVANPYCDETYFADEKFEKVLKDKKTAKLQYILEHEHGVEFDYYTSNIPAGDLIPKVGQKFWQSPNRFLKLNNDVIFLRMSDPRERVLYYALTARLAGSTPVVALSYSELTENADARYCKWYFLDEEERTATKKSRIEFENTLAFNIETLKRDKKNALVTMIKALELEDARDASLKDDRAYILLNEYVRSSTQSAELFNEYFEMMQSKVTRSQIEAYAEIFDFLTYDIIFKRNGKYEVVIKSPTGERESKLFATKAALAKEFIMDPAFKESVEDLRVSLKSKIE